MYKYNCLNPIANIGLDNFNDNFEECKDVNEANGILVRSASMHEMEFSDNLLCIARAGAGVNNIPLDTCAQKGIVVFNTPGANANGVKEMVIAAMLLASRDILGGTSWVKENANDENIAKTTEKAKKQFAGTEIMGKKLGIIGLGAIGVKVANSAKKLGMDVYGYDPYLSVDAAWNLSSDVHHVANVEDIYAKCDIITIHVPALDSTKHMINDKAISMMKDGVIIINLARDILCDEEAVLKGIESGKVRKYVSDFPNPTTAGKDGCIVIPHLGASTAESEDNCAVKAVMEMTDYLENGNISNSVNYPNVNMGVCSRPRIAIFHKNVANMITQFTKQFGEEGINITDMMNKSKGDVAYTMMDLEDEIKDSTVEKLQNIEGVFRVRVVKNKN